MTYALAIDVGTTFTAAAVWRDGRAEAVGLGGQAVAVPSVLFLRDDGVMLVGEAAEARSVTEPDRVAREFKRRFGDDVPMVLGDTPVTPTDLVADMIRFVVDKVREREAQPPSYVLLTCPATWSDYRRGLMEKAAGLAGLGHGEVGLLDEPTAAATYYAAQERLDPGDLLAVYDLGGGTFDATVLRKTAGGFEPLGEPGGDDEIGGVDLDQAVLDHVARAVGPSWYELDTADPATARALAAVHAAAVTAKETLSTDVRAEIPVILPGINLVVRITRDDLEDAARILTLRTVDALRRTVRGAGVEAADLRGVLLVGGSSRIPLVARTIEATIGVPVAVDTHPKLAICLGGAIAAGARLSHAQPSRAQPSRAQPSRPVPAPRIEPPPSQVDGRARDDGERDDADRADTGTPTHERHARDLLVGPRAAPAGPVVTVDVDLGAAGLTAPSDQPLRPAASAPRTTRLADRDTPLVVTTGGDRSYQRAGRRTAGTLVIATVAAALVIGGVGTAVAVLGNHHGDEAQPTREPASAGSGSVATARSASLTGGAIATGTAGGSYALAARPGGGLVAVGAAGSGSPATGLPTAWWTGDSTTWHQGGALPLPAGASAGTAQGLAVAGNRLVAVGWATTGSGQAATAWTSTDGQQWQATTVDHATAAAMHDVIALPDGGLLAVGQDFDADGEGDGAVWASDDGATWRRVTVSGIDGLGTQALDRVAALADGDLLAVGQEPSGAGTTAHVRRSTDGITWATLDTDLPADAEVTGLARLPDDRLLATGSLLAGGGREPMIWVVAPTATHWEAEAPRGIPATGALLGASPGSGVAGTVPGPAPAVWTVSVDQARQPG